jgi:hypothetical protein
MSKNEARRIAQWRTRASRRRLRMTLLERQGFKNGYKSGYVNGQIAAICGDEKGNLEEDIDAALAPKEDGWDNDDTPEGCAWISGWSHGWHAGYEDTERAGAARNPEVMAEIAEQEVLARDPQETALSAYRIGWEQGASWEENDGLPEYSPPPIQTMPEDEEEAHRTGFIAGYCAQGGQSRDAVDAFAERHRDGYPYWLNLVPGQHLITSGVKSIVRRARAEKDARRERGVE